MKKAVLVCFLLLMTASIIYPLREYLGYTNLLYWLMSSAVFLADYRIYRWFIGKVSEDKG